MVCPFGEDCVTSVIDSRKNSEGIRRRRECSTCGLRFTTYEKADISLMVEKRSGDIEEFSYEKLYQGIDNAFGGMPTFQLGAKFAYDILSPFHLLFRFIPRPAHTLFLYQYRGGGK